MQRLKLNPNNRIRFDFPIHPISSNQSKSKGFIDSERVDTVALAKSCEKGGNQLTKRNKRYSL